MHIGSAHCGARCLRGFLTDGMCPRRPLALFPHTLIFQFVSLFGASRHVRKQFYTSGRDVRDRLWEVYQQLLSQPQPRNCIAIKSVRFDDIDSRDERWSALLANPVVKVDLQLEPVGSSPVVANPADLLTLLRYAASTCCPGNLILQCHSDSLHRGSYSF